MIFVKHNSLKLDKFFNPIFIPGFSGSRFFRVQVFQGPGFSGSMFFRVRVQGPGPELRVQVRIQGPGPGSRVRVQGPGPGFRSSRERLTFSELRFSRFKKIFTGSVFGELQLTQISLNFQTSCCNLKIRGL